MWKLLQKNLFPSIFWESLHISSPLLIEVFFFLIQQGFENFLDQTLPFPPHLELVFVNILLYSLQVSL